MQPDQSTHEQSKLQKILLENFTALKIKNPSYSLRAYSKKMNIGHAALSEMMNGKRKISYKSAHIIVERLNLSPIEKNKILKIERSKSALKLENSNYMQLEMDQYHMISDWYYFAILSLAETENFQDDPKWIAERLNIRTNEAKTAIERLERLNLLIRNDQRQLIPTGKSFKTTDDVSSATLRKSHIDNLELAKISLENDAIEIRDMSSMTMAVDPDLLPQAKKMIQNFRRQLTQFLESEKKQEVYKLNIQLFPLSKKGFLK